jgi:tetratricopeptide (TPR) repeat protein/CHAT domain-containing protein
MLDATARPRDSISTSIGFISLFALIIALTQLQATGAQVPLKDSSQSIQPAAAAQAANNTSLSSAEVGVDGSTVALPQVQTETTAEELNGKLARARVSGNRGSETDLLDQLALFYAGNPAKAPTPSAYVRALKFYQEELKLARLSSNKQAEVRANNGLGDCYRHQGKTDLSSGAFQQALDLAETIADKRGEAASLNGLGSLQLDKGDYKKALTLQGQAITLAQAAGDKDLEATILRREGSAHELLGDHEKAIECYRQALPIFRAANNLIGEAWTLQQFGEAYSGTRDKERMIESYSEAIALFHRIGDREDEAATLSSLGMAYYRLSEDEKAVKSYTEELVIHKQLKEYKAQALTLHNEAAAYEDLGNRQKALALRNRSRLMYRSLKDQHNEAWELSFIGKIYQDQDDNQKAIQAYKQELSLFHNIKEHQGETVALGNIAAVYKALGEPGRALEFYNQALTIDPQMDKDDRAFFLMMTGPVYSDIGDIQGALSYYAKALALFREVKDRLREGGALKLIGDAYQNSGDYKEALDSYNKAVPIFVETEEHQTEADTLMQIGVVYYKTGDKKSAFESFDHLLAFFRDTNDTDDEARALENIGGVLKEFGQYQMALDYYTKALPVLRELKDCDCMARALTSMGDIYEDFGEYEKAGNFYSEARTYARQHAEKRDEAAALRGIGDIHWQERDNKKALDFYNQALLAYREMKDLGGEGHALADIGDVYESVGRPDKALEYYNQALPLFRKIGERHSESWILISIGRSYDALGRSKMALRYFEQALQMGVYNVDPMEEAAALSSLQTNQRATNPELAIFFGKQAVNLLQQVRDNMQGLDKELQRSFLSVHADEYHTLADLLISENRLPEAQQVLSMMKQKQFEQFTRREASSASGEQVSSNKALNEDQADAVYRKATQNLIADYQEFVSLSKQRQETTDKNQLARTQPQYEDLKLKVSTGTQALPKLINDLRVILAAKGTRTNGQDDKTKLEKWNENAPWLKNTVENPGWTDPAAVALYTLVVDKHYRVLLFHKGGFPKAYSTDIKSTDLRALAAGFVELLDKDVVFSAGDLARLTRILDSVPAKAASKYPPTQTRDALERAYASRLYQILLPQDLDSDLKALGAHTLVWELDDVLHYIPISALYNAKTQQFLVETYASAIFTPASKPSEDEAPTLDGARMLAMGTSERYDISLDGKSVVFGKLEHVPEELGGIVRDDPRNPNSRGLFKGTEWLDDDFTEKNLLRELGQHYKIVHLATHFNDDPGGNDFKSFLVLDGKSTGRDQAGGPYLLRLNEMSTGPEMQNVFEGVELLTLSACQTATSTEVVDGKHDGHEVEGLGGIAQEQGAHAVLATLWKVDDESTAELTKRFYQLWADPVRRLTKAEALRQAQTAMLKATYVEKDEKNDPSDRTVMPPRKFPCSPVGKPTYCSTFNDPYYWAPFILMGNWK